MGFLFFSRSAARRRRANLEPCYSRKRRAFSYPFLESRSLLEARRRFSHVTRRLSTSIGWKATGVPTADIVAQARMMCVLYIRCRLRMGAVFWNKWGLKVDVSDAENWSVAEEVFPLVLCLGRELEGMHPEVYTEVCRQASSKKVLTTEKAVHTVITGVTKELAESGITWAKVVSLFAVTGGLAVDCVRQGHPEFLRSLVMSMGEALDDHVGEWIAHNGSWMGLCFTYRAPSFFSFLKDDKLIVAAVSSFVLFAVICIIFFWLKHFH